MAQGLDEMDSQAEEGGAAQNTQEAVANLQEAFRRFAHYSYNRNAARLEVVVRTVELARSVRRWWRA